MGGDCLVELQLRRCGSPSVAELPLAMSFTALLRVYRSSVKRFVDPRDQPADEDRSLPKLAPVVLPRARPLAGRPRARPRPPCQHRPRRILRRVSKNKNRRSHRQRLSASSTRTADASSAPFDALEESLRPVRRMGSLLRQRPVAATLERGFLSASRSRHAIACSSQEASVRFRGRESARATEALGRPLRHLPNRYRAVRGRPATLGRRRRAASIFSSARTLGGVRRNRARGTPPRRVAPTLSFFAQKAATCWSSPSFIRTDPSALRGSHRISLRRDRRSCSHRPLLFSSGNHAAFTVAQCSRDLL